MEVKAVAKDVGISPTKTRLVVNMVRGKKVDEALTILKFAPTPAARAVAKVVRSAVANAENNYQLSASDLKVRSISADKARHLKRYMPRARGHADQILKRYSHITVIVSDQEE